MSLQLPFSAHWELSGTPDSAVFLRSLPAGFPSATTMFIEATSMARDVENLLTTAVEPGPYLPARQTIWPRSLKLRVRFDESLLLELSRLAENHAEPEMFDHLMLYADSLPLLEYPDAFLRGSFIHVAPTVVEERLRSWAHGNQLTVLWCAS
jgi:hypothetical protein